MTEAKKPQILSRRDGHNLRYYQTTPQIGGGAGESSGFIWCGGLKSDMEGGKAVALHDWASGSGRDYVRFDYYGHGVSDGDFADGNISRWRDDTLAVLDELTQGPQILIGSSMGGWVSLLAALARPERVAGLLLIAPAPDFTQHMWDNFPQAAKDQIMTQGLYLLPSEYGAPYEITRQLIDDGRANSLLGGAIKLTIPVRILQGASDAVVTPERSLPLLGKITSEDIVYNLVKGGDHSLSREADLKRLIMWAEELEATIS